MNHIETRSRSRTLTAWPAIIGCIIAVLAFLPAPPCVGLPDGPCRAQSAAGWGAPPAPPDSNSLVGGAPSAGVRPAYDSGIVLPRAAECALPGRQTIGRLLRTDAFVPWRSAGVRLSRAPPRNSTL